MLLLSQWWILQNWQHNVPPTGGSSYLSVKWISLKTERVLFCAIPSHGIWLFLTIGLKCFSFSAHLAIRMILSSAYSRNRFSITVLHFLNRSKYFTTHYRLYYSDTSEIVWNKIWFLFMIPEVMGPKMKCFCKFTL